MKKAVKKGLTIVVIMTMILTLALYLCLQLGFESPWSTFYFMLAFTLVFVVPMSVSAILLRFIKRQQIKKAEEKELHREDDILLQATAFSQSALWIYLNLLPANLFVGVMKWIIPAIAITFYSMRAYAKLKESNKWRYRSIYALSYVVSASVFVLVISLIGANWQLLMIENVSVTLPLLLPVFGFAYFGGRDFVESYFKKRYGLATEDKK